MLIQQPDIQLTYCTNIHPSKSLEECLLNVGNYGGYLKEKLAKQKPFGIGLRLSNAEVEDLLQNDRLKFFKEILAEKNLYVFTMNGFPYGNFHHQPVKDQVHYPDWQSRDRVNYTLNLVNTLAQLLPYEEGSISTSPLTYKSWIKPKDTIFWDSVSQNLIEIVHHCALVRQKTGKWIHIDIESEPDGMLQKTEEVIYFFENHLLRKGINILAKKAGIEKKQAEQWIREHIQVCYDICHAAVMYEKPETLIQSYEQAGIGIGKMQISAALKVIFDKNPADNSQKISLLEDFAESVYLHQVCERKNQLTTQYPDLPDALAKKDNIANREWRIHFHVPIFIESYQSFFSTQQDIVQALNLFKSKPFTRHLEIETYTWSVLPTALKVDLARSIHREYTWVLEALNF